MKGEAHIAVFQEIEKWEFWLVRKEVHGRTFVFNEKKVKKPLGYAQSLRGPR